MNRIVWYQLLKNYASFQIVCRRLVGGLFLLGREAALFPIRT